MSISLNSIGNLYNTSVTNSNSNVKASELEDKLNNIENGTDEELMEACKSFESYFVEQVFKSMQSTIMKDEDSSSSSGYSDYFQDMLTQEYASNATESGGYGIAQMLYESMKRQ